MQELHEPKRIYILVLFLILMIISIKLTSLPQLPFLNPISTPKSTFDIVSPLLKKVNNEYHLKHNLSLINQVNAAPAAEAASSYAVIDFDNGQIVAEKNIDQPLPIASLTKVMTAVVALDLASPDELFTISQDAANEIPTKIGVEPGQKMSLRELLHAILLTSANDAADVIREGIDTKYGDQVFIRAMNEKAAFLGLKHSHFMNPQGFDNDAHYSTAEDLAILSHYALQNYPLIDEIVKKDYQFLPANNNHKQFDLYNWNGLLDVYPGIYGVKIGNTARAETTMIAVSERSGRKVLAVVLGAPKITDRDMWTAQLLDLGFEEIAGLPPVNVTQEQLLAKYRTWVY